MEIVLSTRNISKIEQIKAVLAGLNITVLSLDEAGIHGEAIEDGTTLEENALKKALFAQTGDKVGSRKLAMADDTGIFIDALGGEPGIKAARWAGKGATTEDTMNFTLRKLSGVPIENRKATFKTVAAVVSPEGEHQFFTGSIQGTILTAPRIACQPNMPYSAIFLPDGKNKVWAEMSVDEENAISHRGQAFRQVRDFLAVFKS